jgi:GntR family transcriptional repressor for pyruvate dehydrogenase complex
VDTAADRAAAGIRALIVSSHYEPGARLPAERELALQLGLSRPALREGIRRLRSGGVLDSRRGSGTYVAQVDLDGVFDIRRLLEPLAAERAARLRTAAELTEMRATFEALRDAIDDADAWKLADARFHALVAVASRSPVLQGTLERLEELSLLTRAVADPIKRPRKIVLIDEVERVLQSIERGHPKRAANAMERHVVSVVDDYMRGLDSRAKDRDGARAPEATPPAPTPSPA